MLRLVWLFSLGLMLCGTVQSGEAAATPVGNCSSEGALTERTDIAYCEPFDTVGWWRGKGYLKGADPTKSVPAVSEHFVNATRVSDDCVSGTCLRVGMPQYLSGALSVFWPLSHAGLSPDQTYLRLYMKLESNFDPTLCDADGKIRGSGGKFPGLADIRTNASPSGQCGNGGNWGDGINCWSMRGGFRNCYGSGGAFVCDEKATTRYGGYLYYGQKECCASGDECSIKSKDGTGVACNSDSDCRAGDSCVLKRYRYGHAFWDTIPWARPYARGECDTHIGNISDCRKRGGPQGLVPGRWYLIEHQVKMNTVGKSDGIIRGWIDGKLVYEKTNMVFRLAGHDNLHVRTVWLNVHAGGEFVGLCEGSALYMDQMVIATGETVGPLVQGGVTDDIPDAPVDLTID